MLCRSTRKSCILAFSVFLCAAGLSLLQAQQGGTLSGTVLDQTGKAISGASVEVKSESDGESRKTTTDAEGRFSAPDLPAGTYSVVVSAPGFALTTRSGGQVKAGATLDVPITIKVETVATEVTVNDSISLAEVTAPSGNTLEAVSARTEITPAFIKNFMSPLADYAEVVNYAPGTFSLNPNGIGLGQGKTFFRGFPDGDYTMTFDGIPFEDTNSPTHHSWANFPSGWTASADFDRSPGLASTFGPTKLRRIHQPKVAGVVSRPGHSRNCIVRLMEYAPFSTGRRFRLLRKRQPEQLPDGYSTVAVRRISNVQPSKTGGGLR
jgi:iron complex outermembrane receptor protein